ncbi:MAG TPA: lysophospholipid acyltransferase family protein [Blastocatellia bacterium]|nr:lysophospholipid acyltransferase family protein [Blastocatellia bacterium]
MQTEVKSPTAPLPRVGLLPKLRYYWTYVVAALCFLILGVPLIPLAFFLRRFFGNQDFIYPPGKFGAYCYLRAAGARVQASGHENLDPTQPYVFVSNHQSNLDAPLIIVYLQRNPGWIAKQELFRVPMLSQGIQLVHAIPIDRRNRESAIASTRRAGAVIRSGRSVVAFVEGTRTVDGRLKEFKKGAFYMAIEAGVPVVPLIINDTRLVMRKGTNYCLPHDVSLEILPPISTAGYTAETVGELIAKVRAEFLPRVNTD